MSGYVKTFIAKKGDIKLISFCREDEKLLVKYKTIWTKTEYLKNIELNFLPVCHDRYIKTNNNVYTNFVA